MAQPAHNRNHLLLLAGSGEARDIAATLAETPGAKVTASLLHPARSFGPLAVPTRIGRFGGEAGLAGFVRSHSVSAILDATHPFAVQIGHRALRVCERMGLPYARVLRPPWQPGPGDRWTQVADESAVAAHLAPDARVFTTTGRATLDALVKNSSARFLVRQMVGPVPETGMKNVTYVIGSGPFSVEEEIRTLRDLRIDTLVVKNSGGVPSRTKLDAARELGLPVILIARPPQPPGRILETTQQALDWVAGL